jgi:N-acyl amino acid synthase of PEP-CTERM/exosortase system
MIGQLEHAVGGLHNGIRLRRFRSPTYYEAFEGVAADTEQLHNECFRVRHHVYCSERQFLSAADNAGGLERDEYDSRSLHALLRYRKTGEFVGTVRLVVAESDAPGRTLPMYDLLERCGRGTSALPPAAATAEISRFALSRDFRRRLGDADHGDVNDSADGDRRSIPHMALGLMAMAFRMSLSSGSDFLCAVMEPSLIRLLSRFAIRWQEVGPLLDYHGLRQPCIARVDEMAATVAAERPDIWEFITQSCSSSVEGRQDAWEDALAAA